MMFLNKINKISMKTYRPLYSKVHMFFFNLFIHSFFCLIFSLYSYATYVFVCFNNSLFEFPSNGFREIEVFCHFLKEKKDIPLKNITITKPLLLSVNV